MAKTDFVQINLKLTPELLEKIDAAVTRAGNTNRSDWLRATITTACEGRLPSLPASGGSGIDQEARDAMTKLAVRMKEMQDAIEKMNFVRDDLEKKEARLAALEAERTKPAPAPFNIDI